MMTPHGRIWLPSIVVLLLQSTAAFQPLDQQLAPAVALQGQTADGLIAYIGSDGNVWLVGSDGTDGVQVTADSAEVWEDELTLALKIDYQDPIWSPTGTALAFQRNELKLDPSAGSNSKYRISQGVWIYDLTGELSELIEDNSIHGFIWTPDGSGMVLAPAIPDGWWVGDVGEEELTGLLRIDIEDRNAVEIVPTSRGFPLARPQWSPAGGFLSFEEVTGGEGRGMFATFEVAGQSYSPWDEIIGDYSWAPSEENVAFDGLVYAVEPGTSIWKSDQNGLNRIRLTRAGPQEANTSPRYSPSGDLIAFLKESSAWATPLPSRTLWLMKADGSNPRQLTSFDDVSQVAWSPSDQSIAIAKGLGPGSQEIYTLDLGTEELMRIAIGHSPAWQPIQHPANQSAPESVCGTWFWEGPYAAKDLRIATTVESADPGATCRGRFRFANMTGLPGVFGYTLELKVQSENAIAEWVSPTPLESSPDLNYSLPSLDAILDSRPVDPTLAATVTVRGNTSLNSFKHDLSLFLLKNALGIFGCAVPEEQVILTAIELSNLGVLDRTVELVLRRDFSGAKDEFFTAVDDFFRLAALEATQDCLIRLTEEFVGLAVVKLKLFVDLVGYAAVLLMDYRNFEGQSAEILLAYRLPRADTVTPTEIEFFEPEGATGPEDRGSCWTFSIATPRSGAWRCMSEQSQIFDPCFSDDQDPSSVICGAMPWIERIGFRFILTDPLPKFVEPVETHPWFFELEDGTLCYFLSTGTTIFTQIEEVIPYGCDDGWVILGWPAVDLVWTAEKARLSADNSMVEETEIVTIRKVWR